MSEISIFRHHAMATHYEVRIADQERSYAAQAAQEAFHLLGQLEAQLSRFRPGSTVSAITRLAPGERMRLPEPVLDCLTIARAMEEATRGAFSVTAAALQTQPNHPEWRLISEEYAIQCESGRVELDLGAVGKGFALDRMAALLGEWDCNAFLLIAGGSSILAGAAPAGHAGWSCGLGDDNAAQRLLLENASLSGSGLGVKGSHIFDPRTGQPAQRQTRAWALTDSAAESDALSTACMVLAEEEIAAILDPQPSWLVFLEEDGPEGDGHARPIGKRPIPGARRE